MAQIGTIKVETAGGPVELPVYDLGDSGSDRVEAFRVQTASGPGFVPLTDVSAADRPYLRVQTGNGVKAFDTSASGIPDSAIHQWKLDEGTGTSVGDSIGSLGGSVSSATWTSVSDLVGGYGLSFDGTDDKLDFDSTESAIGESQAFAVGVTINLDSLNDGQYIWAQKTGSNNRVWISVEDSEIQCAIYDGSFVGQSSLGADSDTSRMRLLVNFSGGTTTTIFKNATDATVSGNSTSAPSNNGHAVGYSPGNGRYLGGVVDNVIEYNSTLSASEVQQDYDLQPWT